MARPRRDSRPRLAGLVLLACLLLAACGDDESDQTSSTTAAASTAGTLSVEVEPASAAPGESVQARVVNDGDSEFTYGAAYELEVESSGAWKTVKLPVRAVPEIGYIAPPGGTGPPVQVELPADLAPGSYRVVIQRNVPGVGDLSGEFGVSGEY